MIVAIILFVLFSILFLSVPIAFGLGSLGLGLMLLGDISPLMIPQTFYSVADNFILLAVPMFLMMSNILLKAGVGEDLFNFAQSWVGNFPGGLAIATIVSCSIFAAISGSSVATAAHANSNLISFPSPFNILSASLKATTNFSMASDPQSWQLIGSSSKTVSAGQSWQYHTGI